MSTTEERIHLTNIEGIARLSGVDPDNNVWTQFEVDYFAEQEPGECCICSRTITAGWMCLDGGDEVCRRHVTLHRPRTSRPTI